MTVPGAHIPGWMSEPELAWLGEQASTMRSVVEIGSLWGRSSFALLTACPGTVFCVDPWAGELDGSYLEFMRNVGHFPNLQVLRTYSTEAAQKIDDVDMVFIDGSHDYLDVLADIEAWLPKTRRLLCGHDYGDEYACVVQAVHELLPGVSTNPVGTIWAVVMGGDE